MPLYSFKNVDTGEVIEKSLSLSEREQFLEDNPNLKQVLTTPNIGDSVRLGVTKTDDNFNSLLKNIKKNHLHSNIKTR